MKARKGVYLDPLKLFRFHLEPSPLYCYYIVIVIVDCNKH